MPSLRPLQPRLAARCTPREHILFLARLVPRLSSVYFRTWPIASISQFGPSPLLLEPDIGDLRLLLLDHLVGGGQQRFGDGEAESFGSHLSGI